MQRDIDAHHILKTALEMAESLSLVERLRLAQDLTVQVGEGDGAGHASVLDLCGLGQEIWQQLDAQEYVRHERSSWNG